MKKDLQSKNSSPNALADPQTRKKTIRPQANGGATPLCFGQQRMWFLQQLDPGSPVYNTCRTSRLRGALNVAALTLYAWKGVDGLRLSVEYNTDLFERETIHWLLGHYETLLAGAVADSEQAISRLPLLSEGERRQLLAIGRGPAAAEIDATTLSDCSRCRRRAAQPGPIAAARVHGADGVGHDESLSADAQAPVLVEETGSLDRKRGKL